MRSLFLTLFCASALAGLVGLGASALAGPAAADAAVVIGGDMDVEDGAATAATCTFTFACTFLQDVIDGELVRVPDLGTAQNVVTGLRLRAVGIGAKERLRRLVVDERGTAGAGPADYWHPIENTNQIQELPGNLEVKPGEAIAVDISGGSMLRDSRPRSTADRDAAYSWSPDLGEYERRLPGDVDFPFVGDLQYQVTIEPDADADGFGDETQDGCVCEWPLPGSRGDGGADDGGPGAPPGGSETTPAVAPAPTKPAPESAKAKRVTLVAPAKVKGDAAAITVTNPNAFALKGSLTLIAGKRVAAKGKLVVPAGATRIARLKLGNRARATLNRRGKLSVKALARFREPGGKARTAVAKLTVSRGGSKAPGSPPAKQGGTKPTPPSPAPPTPPAPESPDGAYHGSEGLTVIIREGRVTSFSGDIPTYCTKSKKQKVVSYGMFGDDPDPTVAADGTFAYEATTNYGFVKLKYEGRVSGVTASGHLVVEDRSPMSTPEGKLDFDYCFAGADWTATR